MDHSHFYRTKAIRTTHVIILVEVPDLRMEKTNRGRLHPLSTTFYTIQPGGLIIKVSFVQSVKGV